MTATPNFCAQCGAPLKPNGRFCTQCGQPTLAATPSAPDRPVPVSPTTNEPVIGVIPYVERRKGLFGADTFNLVLTPQRIILATVTAQMLKDEAARAAEEAKSQGKGFLGRTAATWNSRAALWQKYMTMPVADILTQHPGNSFIPLPQVKWAKIDRTFDSESNAPDRLIIDTTAGKHAFELKNAGSNETRNLLKQVLGSVMK
jgi:hypothetical protein